MKKCLKIESPSSTKSYTRNLPKPFNPEQEIHRACRDGASEEVAKLIEAHPDFINTQDGKVVYSVFRNLNNIAWLDSAVQSDFVRI